MVGGSNPSGRAIFLLVACTLRSALDVAARSINTARMTPPDLLQLAAGAAILGLAALSTGVSFGHAWRGSHLLTTFFACFAAANLFGLVLLVGQAWLSPNAVRWLRVIEVPLVYLLGPLLYGHARTLLTPGQAAATPLPVAHLLPAVLAFAISLLNALAPFEVSPLGDVLFQLSFHGWLLQGAPYLLATLWLSLRTSSAPRGTAIQRSGLRGLAVVMAGCWLASAMNRWPPDAGPVADTMYAPPVMADDSYIEDASGTTRIPFDLINNHVYIEAEVDGQPARFLVDTGAINLLTPTAAKRLGLTTAGRLSVHGAGDNASDLGLAQARHLRIGGAHLANPVFHIIDLGQQINSMGVPHDGFIGYETFLRFVTTFDYGARVLSFTRPGHYQPPANAVVLSFEQDDRAPVLNGELDGIPLRLWLDTGSRNSLSLSSPFVRTHGLLEKYHASEEAVLGWGLGGPGRARPARLGVLRMGSIEVTGLVGDLSSTDKGALALADYGAILGGGVLRRFSMGIDYDTKRLHLVPNAESTQAGRCLRPQWAVAASRTRCTACGRCGAVQRRCTRRAAQG